MVDFRFQSSVITDKLSGTTTLKMGENNCISSRKESVYDFIANSIANTTFANGANQEARREELKSACRGINPSLDEKLRTTKASGLPSDPSGAVPEGKPN